MFIQLSRKCFRSLNRVMSQEKAPDLGSGEAFPARRPEPGPNNAYCQQPEFE